MSLAASPAPAYAELHCLSNFSFQRGASQPEELVERAHQLGYRALAITDTCSVAGVVRAHERAQRMGIQLLLGAEFAVELPEVCPAQGPDGAFTLVALVHNLQGWGNLCEFITRARRAAPKGEYRVCWEDAPWESLTDCEVLLSLPSALNMEAACAVIKRAKSLFGSDSDARVWIAVHACMGAGDALALHRLQQMARLTGVPLVAAGDVRMHVRSRKPLHDALQ